MHGAGGWVRGQSWLGFGSGLSPVSPWYHPSVLWGSPSEASGIWVWFSWGGDAPPRMAGLRPQPRWGGLEAQSAWQRALALMARPAAHSQCMQAPLWRAQSGGAELMSQVVVTGATVRASDLSREPERLPCRRVRCRALPAPWRWASQVGMTSLGRRGK